jgi:hypothetical protein
MKTLLTLLAACALALTIAPPLLHWAGALELAAVKNFMAASLVLWFAAALPLSRMSDRR